MDPMKPGKIQFKKLDSFKKVVECFRYMFPYEEPGQRTKDEYLSTARCISLSFYMILRSMYLSDAEKRGIENPRPCPGLWMAVFAEIDEVSHVCKYLVRDAINVNYFAQEKKLMIGRQVFEGECTNILITIQDIFGRTMVVDDPCSMIIDPMEPRVTSHSSYGTASCNFHDKKCMTKEELHLAQWMAADLKVDPFDSMGMKDYLNHICNSKIWVMIQIALLDNFEDFGRVLDTTSVKERVREIFVKQVQYAKMEGEKIRITGNYPSPLLMDDPEFLKKITTTRNVCIKFKNQN